MRKIREINSTSGPMGFRILLGLMILVVSFVVLVIGSASTLSMRSRAANPQSLSLNAIANVTIRKPSRGCDAGTTGYRVQYTWLKGSSFFTETNKVLGSASVSYNVPVSFVSTLTAGVGSYSVRYMVYQVTRGRGMVPLLQKPVSTSVIPFGAKSLKGEISRALTVSCQ